MTLTNILIGLAVWTAISIPASLLIGALIRQGAAQGDLAPAVAERRPLRKSA